MNILLVEDNYNLALNIMEYLEANGNSVNYSTNGTSALDIALAHRFDIIILDIMLPGLDGFEFCKQCEARIVPPSARRFTYHQSVGCDG